MVGLAKVSITGERDRCSLSNISDIYCGDTSCSQWHRICAGFRNCILQRQVILVEIVRSDNRERPIKFTQGISMASLDAK